MLFLGKVRLSKGYKNPAGFGKDLAGSKPLTLNINREKRCGFVVTEKQNTGKHFLFVIGRNRYTVTHSLMGRLAVPAISPLFLI